MNKLPENLCDKNVKKKLENAYVNPVPRGSKTASQPNTLGPLAGTIVPSVLPSNKTGSDPGKKDKNISKHTSFN